MALRCSGTEPCHFNLILHTRCFDSQPDTCWLLPTTFSLTFACHRVPHTPLTGSGSTTHNLSLMGSLRPRGPTLPWVRDFLTGLDSVLLDPTLRGERREQALVQGASAGHTKADGAGAEFPPIPGWAKAHPREEHIMPLFVVVGAGGDDVGTKIHDGMAMQALSQAAYAFGWSKGGGSDEAMDEGDL